MGLPTYTLPETLGNQWRDLLAANGFAVELDDSVGNSLDGSGKRFSEQGCIISGIDASLKCIEVTSHCQNQKTTHLVVMPFHGKKRQVLFGVMHGVLVGSGAIERHSLNRRVKVFPAAKAASDLAQSLSRILQDAEWQWRQYRPNKESPLTIYNVRVVPKMEPITVVAGVSFNAKILSYAAIYRLPWYHVASWSGLQQKLVDRMVLL